MDYISATLEICTFYKGLPHGIALIAYTDPERKHNSFRGVGVFYHGQLNNAPFTWVDGEGDGVSFSKMQNGRPADGSYYTYFNGKGAAQYADSLKAKSLVQGW
jgi:hypothetical protein